MAHISVITKRDLDAIRDKVFPFLLFYNRKQRTSQTSAGFLIFDSRWRVNRLKSLMDVSPGSTFKK